MKIIFKEPWYHSPEHKVEEWIAYFEDVSLKGMVETGETKQEAFDELMVSLKVKLAFDNNLMYSKDLK